jgi:hypothetical protein
MAGMPTMGQFWLLLALMVAGIAIVGGIIALVMSLARYREPPQTLASIGLKGFFQEWLSLALKFSTVLLVMLMIIVVAILAT